VSIGRHKEMFCHLSYGAFLLNCRQGSMGEMSALNDMRMTSWFLAVGKFPNTVSGLLQWVFYTAESYCCEVGLSVNRDKTGI
jgi:hypothetical protein